MTRWSWKVRPMMALLAVCMFDPGAARAAGWEIEVQGLRALASSYAGRSTLSEDASAAWFNPAAMVHARRWTMTSALPLVNLDIEFRDGGSTSILGAPMLGERSKDGGALNPVPHLYLVGPIHDRMAFGFSFNVPFGLGTDYDETWTGRYHATETTLLVYNLNPSLAARVTDRLSVGAGVSLQISDAVLANMIDFGSIGFVSGLGLTPQQHDGKVQVDGDDVTVGFNLGVLWEPDARTRAGMSFRSKTVHRLEGPATFSVPAEAQPLTAGGTVFQNTTAVANLPMPAFASFGLSRQFGAPFTLLADVTWTGWDAFSELSVNFENPSQPTIRQPADWKDVVRVSLGAIYAPGGRWSFRAGGAHIPAAVRDATREPRVPEGYHSWATVGTTYRISDRLELDAVGVHLFSEDVDLDLTNPNAGRLVGRTEWNVNTIGVGGTYRF